MREHERAIMEYIHHWNESGKRFVWAKSSEQILQKVRKAAQIQVCCRLRDTGIQSAAIGALFFVAALPCCFLLLALGATAQRFLRSGHRLRNLF